MNATKETTNEDLLDMMQSLMRMTSEGFAQINAQLRDHTRILKEHTSILGEHSQILRGHGQEIREFRLDINGLKAIIKDLSSKHAAYLNNISDILDRIVVLEKRGDLSKLEAKELQRHLQALLDWTARAAEVVKIPLKFPS